MEKDEVLQIIEEAARNMQVMLDLSGKGLTSLPPEIGELTDITRLTLSNKSTEVLAGGDRKVQESNLALPIL